MMQNKQILGITGGVGAGKSTVLEYLESRYDALVIQCDRVAFELEQKGGACYCPVVELLGSDIVDESGEIDRKKTAAKVFADPELLEKLNRIVHPAVKQEVRNIISENRRKDPEQMIVIEAALLFEDHYDEICDEIWYIHTDASVRAERLKISRGYSDEKIKDIMHAQKPDAYYCDRADLVIENSSPEPEDAQRQTDRGLRTHGFLHDCQREQR